VTALQSHVVVVTGAGVVVGQLGSVLAPVGPHSVYVHSPACVGQNVGYMHSQGGGVVVVVGAAVVVGATVVVGSPVVLVGSGSPVVVVVGASVVAVGT
jgi:hypothetical protein